MLGWRPSKTGSRWSYWRHVSDGDGVTVFQDDQDRWKWVFDGEFSAAFDSLDDAMQAAENELDLS